MSDMKINFYDIMRNINQIDSTTSHPQSGTISLEARNASNDEFLRVNTSPVFVAETSVMDPVIVISLTDTPKESMEVFKRLKQKKSLLLVNRMNAYYMPRVLKERLPFKTLITSLQREYAQGMKLKSEYGITQFTNVPNTLRENSVLQDLSYVTAAIKKETIEKKRKLTRQSRIQILETYKKHILEISGPKYVDRIVYCRAPIFEGTGIQLSMTDSQMINRMNPVLLFLEWLQNDSEGFCEWAIANRVHFAFEGITRKLFIMPGTEAFMHAKTFKPRNVFRYIHMVDGKTEEEVGKMTDSTEDPTTIAPIVDDSSSFSDSNVPVKITVTEEKDIIEEDFVEELDGDSADGEMSAILKKEEEKGKKLEEVDEFEDLTSDVSLLDNSMHAEEKKMIISRNKQISEDLDEIVNSTLESSVGDTSIKKGTSYYEIIEDTKSSSKEKAVNLLETHNYSNLKDSVETKEIRQLKTKLRKTYGKPIDEVVNDLKKHKLDVLHFPTIDDSSSYSKSNIDNLQDSYRKTLKKVDRENIYLSPMELSYPVLFKGVSEKNISDREFAGKEIKLSYESHNGVPIDIELEIPETVNGKLFMGGSYKKLNLQDAAKPVIKTDEDVIITTAYNKTILNIKGKYPSTKQKAMIGTLKKLSKECSLLKVKTTDELGAFIYNNLVSYNMIHLNRHFNGMISDSVNIDFRGLRKDEKNPGWTVLGEYQEKPVIHQPEQDLIKWNGTTSSSLDFIASIAKWHYPELYKLCEVKQVTLSQVNAVYARIMAKDLPVILILLIACPFKKLLQRMHEENDLDWKVVSNEYIDQKKLHSNAEYGIIRLATSSVIIKYNNVLNEIIWIPLTLMDLTKYETFDITNIMETYVGNSNTSLYIENFKECFLDPITVRVCDMYNIPSDFVGIFIYACSLFTDYKTTYKSDSRNYRLITTEETINRCVYDVLAKAFSDNAAKVKRGSRPRIQIPKDAVIRRIQELPNLSESNPLSPFREIQDSRKKSMKGHYGLNNDRAYNAETRAFNEHNLGTETIATPYSANAGVIKNLPFNPSVNSLTGEYQTVENTDEMNPSNYLSFSESYVTYSNCGHVNRQMMTSGQFDHIRSIENADPLLVSSRVDEAAAYISPTFSYVAKDDGTITEVNSQFIKVKYKNGETDAIPLESVNKNTDKGYYVKNDFTINDKFKEGSKVKKNDLVAYNKRFFKKKPNGQVALCQGKMAMIYICDDENVWEDSCIPFSDLSENLANRIVKRIARVVDVNTEIRDPFLKIGEQVSPSDILFKYKSLTDDESINAMIQGTDDLTLKEVDAHHRGKLLDIKVFYRNSPNIPMSPSIKKLIRDVGDIQRVSRHMGSIKDITSTFDRSQMDSTPQLLTRGKESKINGDVIENGQILIEYYIEIIDKLGSGDKIVLHSALKAEPTTILDKSLRPVGIDSGRKASLMFSTYSQLARMVADMFLTGLLHSILFHIAIDNMRALGIEPDEDDILHYRSSYNQSKTEWK